MWKKRARIFTKIAFGNKLFLAILNRGIFSGVFEADRALGYNLKANKYFAAGHQVAISQDGETWAVVLALITKDKPNQLLPDDRPTSRALNIQAIVPVGNMTLLLRGKVH